MKKGCLDFYVIGAQKAGTTWLHHRLNEIEGYNLPLQKEMHFFHRSKLKYPQHPSKFSEPLPTSEALKRGGKSLVRNLVKGRFYNTRERYLYYFGKYDLSWYQSYMSLHAQKGITGDITPAYATLQKEDVKLMAQVAPNAKVFYILRDPVERRWSQWRMYLNNHDLKPQVNDLQLFKKWHDNLRPYSYLNNIATFSSYFQENFFLLFFDAIDDQPYELLQNVHQKIAPALPLQIASINVEKKEQQSFTEDMNPEIYQYLLTHFNDELKDLHLAIGGYCTHWYRKHSIRHISNPHLPKPLIEASSIKDFK